MDQKFMQTFLIVFLK